MPNRMPGRALVHACKVFPALFTSVSRIRCLLPLPVLVATAWAEGVHSPDFTSLRRSGTALQSRDPRELWASCVVHSLRDGRDTCLSPGLGLGRTVHSVKGQRSAIVHPATSAALLLDQGMPWRRWHVDAGCPHKALGQRRDAIQLAACAWVRTRDAGSTWCRSSARRGFHQRC